MIINTFAKITLYIKIHLLSKQNYDLITFHSDNATYRATISQISN